MTELNNNNITIFGETNYRNAKRSFGIKRDDRRRHMYIIGKTGMGKTTLLENLIISDILNGEGCCYIDPHGDTADKILDFIPSHRINDVVYINPADTEFPIAFNVLEAVNESSKSFIASGLISVFKKLWADSWGPRLEYILRNAILSLLDYPGSTLLGIMRILVEKEYRDKVVAKIKDPVVKSFWTKEYDKWNEKTLQEVISPIQNKVGQFLSNFLIRNIVGQVKSTIDLREIMDNKKILILNLSKGRIGEDTMQLLGSMIVTKLYLAAMSRVDIPESERNDFYLYVDEFQNFATESFANILSEARKYRLNLIVAHQYIQQLPEVVASAVFGNVGTIICFRVGAADAEILVREFTPFFTEEDLVNLPAFSIYLKLMIDGVASDPFSASTLPPLFENYRTNNREKVIAVSRERYANPRAIVEDKINRWSTVDVTSKINIKSEKNSITNNNLMTEKIISRQTLKGGPTISLSDLGKGKLTKKQPIIKSNKIDKKDKKKEEKNKLKYDAKCSICGKIFKISFNPDPNKPVYCDDCFKKVKAERRNREDDIKPIKMVMLDEPVIKEETLKVKPVSLSEILSQDITGFDGKVRKPKQDQVNIENIEEEYKLEWYEQAKKLLGENMNKQKELNSVEDLVQPNNQIDAIPTPKPPIKPSV